MNFKINKKTIWDLITLCLIIAIIVSLIIVGKSSTTDKATLENYNRSYWDSQYLIEHIIDTQTEYNYLLSGEGIVGFYNETLYVQLECHGQFNNCSTNYTKLDFMENV